MIHNISTPTFLVAVLIVLLLVVAAYCIICAVACRRLNNVSGFDDVLAFMLDRRYRALSILRHRFISECGQEGDYRRWKESVDVDEICRFRYQVKYIPRNCLYTKSYAEKID